MNRDIAMRLVEMSADIARALAKNVALLEDSHVNTQEARLYRLDLERMNDHLMESFLIATNIQKRSMTDWEFAIQRPGKKAIRKDLQDE